MKGRLLLSTTALLAGVALATAQTPQQSERGAGNKSPNASQTQMPQQRGGDAQRDQGQMQQKQGQNQAQQRQGQDQRQPQQAQGRDRNQGRSTTGQATPSDREQKGQAQRKDSQGRAGAERDQRRQDRTTGQGQQGQRDQAGQQQQRDRDTQRGAQQQRDRDAQRGAQRQKQQTEGRAGDTDQRRAGRAGRDRARGSVDLTVQQRTRIRQTVLARSNVPRIRDVDFALRVGIVVPSHVHFVAVPPVLVDIHPEWRGHRYFVVDEDIVIVSPSSREIVAVVPLGSSQASAGGAVGGAVAIDLSEPEIRQVQMVLIERGFLDGDADGVFGPRTRSALIAFQRSEGLEATGRITTRTVTALNLSDRITVRGEQRGSGREPSTVGRGNDRMQQRSPQRDQDMNGQRRGEQMQQPSGRQDMNSERRGQMSPQKSQDQDRATTGQGGDQPKADRGGMNSQMQDRATTGQGGDQTKGERDMSPSTTGQGSDQGNERPAASESPNAGKSSSPSGTNAN